MNCRPILTAILAATLLSTNAQLKDTLDVSFSDERLEDILNHISEQSGYLFSYNAAIMPEGSLFSLERDRIHLDDLLLVLFVGTYLEYHKTGDQIILKKVLRDDHGNQQTTITISGRVQDERTHAPVFGAHVYINGSTFGTYTDENGAYELGGLIPGNYQLVMSHVGYQPKGYEINSQKPATYAINASLDLEINVLDDIEITSAPFVGEEDWKKLYRQFSEEFIGNTDNANKCRLLNPEVIEFTYSDSLQSYEAIVCEPLKMENRALGYLVIFEVDYFKSSDKQTRFHVRAAFEPMEPENRRTRRKWKKNRIRSYYGSPFHFLRSLMRDRLKQEGYRVLLVAPGEQPNDYVMVNRKDELVLTDASGLNYLAFDGDLVVNYLDEYQQLEYQTSYNSGIPGSGFYSVGSKEVGGAVQESTLVKGEKRVRILENGQITQPELVQFYGYWSWERMSELTPIDYDPKLEK